MSIKTRFNQLLSGQFIKYCLVGAFGTGLDFLLLYSLVEYVHLFYLLSAIISVIIVMTINFTLNKYWTFQKRDGSYVLQWLQYGITHAVGVGINLAVLAFLVEVFGMWYILAKVFATAAAVMWNFLATKKWVFKR